MVAQVVMVGACSPKGQEDAVATGSLDVVVRHPVQSMYGVADSDYVMGSVGHGAAHLRINGNDVRVHRNGTFIAFLPVPAVHIGYEIVASRGSDTVRLTYRPPLSDNRGDGVAASNDSGLARRRVFASASPDGVRLWSLLAGTEATELSREGALVKVSANGAILWIRAEDTLALRPSLGRRTSRASLSLDTVQRTASSIDIHLRVSALPAISVDTHGDTLIVTFAASRLERGPEDRRLPDDAVRKISLSNDRSSVQLRAIMSAPVFGFLVEKSARGIVIRVRRPPRIETADVLGGISVVVDPGHPPGGTLGPSGLLESEVTRAVAEEVARMLRLRGARALLTHRGQGASLRERIAIADTSNAHAFVSLHVDAAPSGTNPARFAGTATFAFDWFAYPLAAAIHQNVRRQLSSTDRGIRRADFAVLRQTWMPSVLCEALTLTLPAEEDVLRTRAGRERYARGIVDGLAAYFGAIGAAQAR